MHFKWWQIANSQHLFQAVFCPPLQHSVFFIRLITFELITSARSRGQDEFKAHWGKISIIFVRQKKERRVSTHMRQFS